MFHDLLFFQNKNKNNINQNSFFSRINKYILFMKYFKTIIVEILQTLYIGAYLNIFEQID